MLSSSSDLQISNGNEHVNGSISSKRNELEELYQNLTKQDKMLKKQVNCIKDSMQVLQKKMQLDKTSNKKHQKSPTHNQNFAGPNNATERLKYRDYTRKPSKRINFLENKTGLFIDLYYQPTKPVSTKVLKNGNTKVTYLNGDYSITHKNGIYQIFHGNSQHTHFTNGDIQQRFNNGIIIHEYYENGSIEAVIPDGLRWIVFKNGQIERIDQKGNKVIKYGDGTYQTIPKSYEF